MSPLDYQTFIGLHRLKLYLKQLRRTYMYSAGVSESVLRRFLHKSGNIATYVPLSFEPQPDQMSHRGRRAQCIVILSSDNVWKTYM